MKGKKTENAADPGANPTSGKENPPNTRVKSGDAAERPDYFTAMQRLAAIVKSSDDAIVSKDLNGIITSWNNAAEKMFGYTADEAIGQSIYILIPPDRTDEEVEIIARIRSGNIVDHIQTVRRRKDGSDVDISLSVSPIRDDSGKVVGAAKIARDITDQRRQQEALNQNQLLLTMAIQSSRMGAWERDISAGVIWWSDELEAIFGLAPGEFRGTDEHYYSLIHDDDREYAAAEVRKAIAEHRPYVMEFRFYYADGSVHWMEGRGQAVYSDKGDAVRLYGVGIDITDRKNADQERRRADLLLKESEERFRLSLSSGAVTVYEQDLELRYLWVFPADPYAPDIIGKTDVELTPGPEAERRMMLKRKVIETGVSAREIVSARTPGGEQWFDLQIEPRRDDEGNIIGIGGTALNITEQRKLQQALAESEERFRALMEQAPFSIQLFDPAGNTVSVNQAWQELWGAKLHEIPEYNVRRDPQLAEKGIAPFIERAFAGEPVDIPAINYSPEESIPGVSTNAEPERWVSAVAYPLKAADGTIEEVALVHQDITARKIAEEALRANQERQLVLLRLLKAQRETTDPASIMTFAAEAVGVHIKANRVGFFEMADDDTLAFGESWTDGVLEPLTGLFPAIGIGSKYLTEVRNGRTLGIADAAADPLTSDSVFGEIGARALIGAPIIRNGRWRAGLYVNHSTVREWTSEEVAFVRDVANQTWDAVERARAQIELAEAKTRLETTLAASEIGTWTWDIKNDRVTADENLARLFSLEPGDASGSSMETFVRSVFEADRPKLESAIADAMQDEDGFFETDYRLVDEDGSIRWVTARGRVEKDAASEPIRLPGVIIDITDRKEAEMIMQRYRLLSEHARDVIWLLRPDGEIVEVNQAAVASYGYTREEMIGMNVFEMRHPSTRHTLDAQLRSAANGSVNFETIHVKKDGTAFPVEITANGSWIGGEHFLMSIVRDVSERKKAEMVLRESEERFAKAFNASPLVVTITSLRTGKLTEINQTFVDVTGYSREEAIGRSTDELNLWDTSVDRTVELDTLQREGSIRNREYTFRLKNGTELIGLLSAEMLEIGGEPSALTVIQDVTERKRSEETLRRSERRLQQMADAMPQVVWVADPDGTVTYYNHRVEKFLGIKQTAQGNWDWSPGVHADDARATGEAWDAAVRRGTDYSVEHRLTMADGGFRWHLSRAIPIKDTDGRILQWYGTATDIHEIREAQEAVVAAERQAAEEYQGLLARIVPLAETLGRARDLTSIYRKVGEFIRSSMQCSAFFVSFYDAPTRMRKAAYVWSDEGEVDISKLPPIELTDDGGPNSKAVYGKRSVIVNDYMDVMKTRTHLVLNENGINPMSSVAVPILVMDRVIGTFEVQAYDNFAFAHEHVVALEMAASLAAVAIENVRLIQIEAEARSEAESANRAKDEFLSVLSHELRTPLNAMLGWVRMLRSDVLDKTSAAKALEVIERNTRLQSSLIEDLLDVSRIISGKMRIETEVCDLITVIATVSETVGPLAAAKDITYEFKREAESIFLDADPVRLQQVISNLVQNAIKFTPTSGSITVEARRDKNEAILAVTDTGVGIEPEFLPYIFDRFRQADASTKRNYTGLGLGLTIARTIVTMHGGQIEVDSDGRDAGSVFRVRLPLADEFYSPPVDEKSLLAAGGRALEGISILLVDDDRDSLIPTKLFLENESARTETAESASEALEKIKASAFDILISDIGMPDTDGIELIRAVRQLENGGASIKAVALTAYASEENRENALAAGFQSHLPKPVNFDELLETLKSLL
ncbi:MAG: PAS domain S-box protein [Acidobacteriota bacterium]